MIIHANTHSGKTGECQQHLFDAFDDAERVVVQASLPHNSSDTSAAAARQAAPRAGTQLDAVLALIRGRGEKGLTDRVTNLL